MIIHEKPTEPIAVFCASSEEWKNVWEILIDSGYNFAPTGIKNNYSKGRNDHIRISSKGNYGNDCGFCNAEYYINDHYTIISFKEFLERFCKPQYIIHTPTLAKKVMTQQVLFSMNWLWCSKDTIINKSMEYPYILLNNKEKTFFHDDKPTPKYIVITIEEFLSNPDKYISFPNYVVRNK